VAEHAFDALKAPIVRVARPAVPIAFSPPLEAHVTPNADRIVAAAKKTMSRQA
jgi:pyruvate/2-oxoglutarate/acetoin dehydrogenase E1 component